MKKRKTPWQQAAAGWKVICGRRASQEAGKVIDSVKSAQWSVFWRRRRLEVLVKSAFVCSECFGGIDPDKPFSIIHRDPDRRATPDTPADDLRPVCYACRNHSGSSFMTDA